MRCADIIYSKAHPNRGDVPDGGEMIYAYRFQLLSREGDEPMPCRLWQLVARDDFQEGLRPSSTACAFRLKGCHDGDGCSRRGASDKAAEKAVARRKAVTYISWIALALMTTSSVASLRPAPTMAVYGLACIFLYLVPAIIFLLPTSLVSAELASGYEGGVYNWVARGISKPMGFLAVWCQFAMTIFYYPTLLGFVASTLAYVINPELASSGVWTAIVIVVVYWTGVWVSSRGTKGVAGLASGGLIIGTLIPGAVLVLLGVVFLGQGNPSAAPMTASNLLPAWAGLASLVLIVNNFLSYSGMEMNAVHVSSLRTR